MELFHDIIYLYCQQIIRCVYFNKILHSAAIDGKFEILGTHNTTHSPRYRNFRMHHTDLHKVYYQVLHITLNIITTQNYYL